MLRVQKGHEREDGDTVTYGKGAILGGGEGLIWILHQVGYD